MRINFILPHAGLSGGVRVVAIYCDHLTRRGHQVVAISVPRHHSGLKHCMLCWLRGNGWPKNLPDDASHFDRLDVDHRILDRHRPVTDGDVPDADVVVATWWETAEATALLSPSKGAKVYFIQHDERMITPHLAERVAATCRLPMHKVTVAQWLSDIVTEEYGDPNATLIPNAVDTEQFTAPPRRKNERLTVGVMYSPSQFKAYDVALAAIPIALKQILDLKVVSFGDREPDARLPLPNNSHYTVRPAQDRISDLYASCDVWLVPSRSEGFGLPILEAMACRTPVIATPTGAAPGLLSEGAGILVDVDDAEAIANAILAIGRMTNEHWGTMSARAFAVATGYSWDAATTKFELALETAIRRSHLGEIAGGVNR